MDGKYHDLNEMDEEITKAAVDVDGGKSIYAQSREEVQKQNVIENFEKELRNIIKEDRQRRIKFVDEIPMDIKRQFNLPDEMRQYQLNFHAVKRSDFALKKQKPLWSGQDVLPVRLDQKKSQYITNHINSIRVWPEGVQGLLKRMRCQLRRLVKSAFFDNFMTFAVLLNTITLSMDHYGIATELAKLLDTFNNYFTWIFIVEMLCKIFAVGIGKYCADRMNYLDGGVVILSVVEMIAERIVEGEELGLGAFKTIRMLRTFRVFRIARLLRALKSMQTILGVMVRSYKSFIYITMLMFLFIFIFSLLGIETFGGKMSYEEGTPRGNYDAFSIAFVTVFQVLTMENWQTVLFDSMRSDQLDPYLVSVFYVSWIFLGNFILLNLFLAILLDSFLEEEDEEEANEQEQLQLKKKKLKQKQKKKKMDYNKLLLDLQSPKLKEYRGEGEPPETLPSKLYFGEAAGSDEGEDLEDMDED